MHELQIHFSLKGNEVKRSDHEQSVKIKPTNERVEEEKEKERPYLPPPPYKPHVRMPQKNTNSKVEEQFKKFVEI